MGQKRHYVDEAIKQLIGDRKIASQSALVDALRQEHGIELSQPSVSRRLKNLEIEWDPNSEAYVCSSERRQLEREQKLRDFLHCNCERTVCGDCSVIIFATRPGFAEATAAMLKDTYPEYIFGTIAQNDLVVVLTENDEFEASLSALMKEIVQEQSAGSNVPDEG